MLEKIEKIMYKTDVGFNIMDDLEEYGCEITPKRILEELKYKQFIVDMDGWDYHLKNPQQKRSLKCLINKVKRIIEEIEND